MDAPYIIKGGVAVDDRGVVTFCNEFDMTPIKRFYMLENHTEGFVRAWHGHLKEAKWVTVLSGTAIVGAVRVVIEEDLHSHLEKDYYRYVLHANGDVLYIPPGYANGCKNLVDNTLVMHFSNMGLGEAEYDDFRFAADSVPGIWTVMPR
jgi:dTDP-4-dehydrorhamnose 3,5-epimerase-like enzyme